ncbi:MAG: hypothetical protein FJX23_07050 [Alphaproteobacteria bacterium]|nr:hypothetical protein [Alphaproteobacteria bacterium]
MKGMKTLIKMQQKDLDELRREQTTLEEQREQLIALLTRLENEMNEERRLAEGRMEMAKYLEDYGLRVKERQMAIVQEVIQINMRLEQLGELIATAFGELKKYEITKDNFDKRVQAAVDRREQIMLDEVGLRQFTRKQDE